MEFDIGRMKKWDWAIVVAFVVIIVMVSIPWAGASFMGVGFHFLGWDYGGGVAAFLFALFCVLWVAVKTILPKGPLPKWYAEAWPVMVFGGVITICGLAGTIWARGAWMPGGLLTMIVGLAVVFFGYLMLKDKSGDYGMSPDINIDAIKKAVQPEQGAQPQQGAQAQPGAEAPPQGGKFCTNCGSPVEPSDTACKNCGNAL